MQLVGREGLAVAILTAAWAACGWVLRRWARLVLLVRGDMVGAWLQRITRASGTLLVSVVATRHNTLALEISPHVVASAAPIVVEAESSLLRRVLHVLASCDACAGLETGHTAECPARAARRLIAHVADDRALWPLLGGIERR